jgi:hypothetical protein
MQSVWVITSYFNWSRFHSKIENYWTFRTELEKLGANLLTVECALSNQAFEIPPGRGVIHVRTASLLWQKERLLNIALDALPNTCRFVAWVDCDLIFLNKQLLGDIVAQLQNHAVVQLFDGMIRLLRGHVTAEGCAVPAGSFMGGLLDSVMRPATARVGHPGFAWAGRREILEACNGFYDACIVGGADRVMAHAFLGDYHAPVVSRIAMGRIAGHYLQWARHAYQVVQGSVSVVRGTVLHLWHGDSRDRRYFERHIPVADFDFDPDRDLAKNQWGCWEWASAKRELHEWMEAYFEARREDG